MYKFFVIDTRNEANNSIIFNASHTVVGIELTSSQYANRVVINIDHHGLGTDSETPSACEQALECRLPSCHSALVTERPDADSVTAMAVLELRRERLDFDPELVKAIGYIDRKGPHTKGYEAYRDQCTAIARVAADFNRSMEERVVWVAMALMHAIDKEEIDELVAARDRELAQARANSKVELCLDRRLAIVRSTHLFATVLGYEMADIVLAINPAFPIDPKHPEAGSYKKYTICRRDCHCHIDMKTLLERLNKAEKAACDDGKLWGGRADIIGSPQGRESALSEIQVYSFVWSSMTDNAQHPVRH